MTNGLTPTSTRCGFVALIGAPNAGKSTLINAARRRQGLDRHPQGADDAHHVRGIAIDGAAQIVFVDTPGIFAPKRRLDRAMVDDRLGRRRPTPTWSALLIDAAQGHRRGERGDPRAARRAAAAEAPVLNKIDPSSATKLLALAAGSMQRVAFDATFMISALTGDGVPRPAR